MLTLNAVKRELTESIDDLRRSGWLPAVIYGFEVDNSPLKIEVKEFEKVYREAGESTLVSVVIKGGEKEQSYLSLIQDIQRHPVSDRIIHVDFYHPSEKKKIEAPIPLVFEGESPAVSNFGGTVVKEMQEVEVKGLAAHLPHEIVVDLGALKKPHDRILVKDLSISSEVELLSNLESIVATALPAEDIEEELEKSVEDMVTPIQEEKGEEQTEEEEKEEAKN